MKMLHTYEVFEVKDVDAHFFFTALSVLGPIFFPFSRASGMGNHGFLCVYVLSCVMYGKF